MAQTPQISSLESTLLSALSDEMLVRRVTVSDASAFEVLYKRYAKELLATAYSTLKDKEIAKDIVQDIFSKLWERRESLSIQYIKTYLHRAVYFRVLKVLRKEKYDAQLTEQLRYMNTQLAESDPALYSELRRIYEHAVAGLSEKKKEVFRMVREENMTYKEIADELQIGVDAVHKRMVQAIAQVRCEVRNALGLVFILLFF